METLKILILEDTPDDVGLILRALKKEVFEYTYEQVESQEEFMRALEVFQPNLILSDHALPQFNSIDALKICKEKGLTTPFILVTGTVSEEFAVMCLKLGADDYVLKSNLSRLPIAIRSAMEQRRQEAIRVEQQVKLQQQYSELTKVNKELDAFVYSVSHNLRSPLASVLGLVGVAKMEKPTDAATIEKYFDMIERSVVKLDETLKEILDYSQNSRNDLVVERIDLERLASGAFEQMKYMNGHGEIHKKIDITGKSDFYSDGYRVGVILNNLVSNAIKYKDESKPDSFIRIRATLADDMASIEISDNGIGIPPEQLPKVYTMFYRATEKSDGSGLGLYIVKEMMERLKGEIKIESTLRKGTTVRLEIPNRNRKM